MEEFFGNHRSERKAEKWNEAKFSLDIALFCPSRKTEAQTIVAVIRIVEVAIRYAQGVSIVAPTTAAEYAA